MHKNYHDQAPAVGTREFGDFMVLEGAIMREESYIAWLQNCLARCPEEESKEKPSYKNRKYCEFYNWVSFIACLQGSVSYKRRFHSGKSHRNPLRNPLCTPLRTSGQIKNTPEIIFRSMQIIIRQIFINFLKDIPDFIVTRICLILLPFSCLLQSAF